MPISLKVIDHILEVNLSNDVKAEELLSKIENIKHIIKKNNIKHLQINIKYLNKYDDYLIASQNYLASLALKENISFELTGESIPFKDFYENFQKTINISEESKVKKKNFLVTLGSHTLNTITSIKEQLTYLGDLFIIIALIFVKPKTLRLNETVNFMKRIGVDAIPIIGLISFLMGLIMAFMSSIQLKQFGANIYVASLVGLAMARELGPIMTSIIVAGRTGSAFAAELGTMKISEEIDALKVMGFNITKFLVLPRVVATVIVVPILTIFSNVFANIGGLLVGIFMLNLTSTAYLHQLYSTLSINHILHGIIKSALFAFLIAEIGCYRGLAVEKGTEDVGRATTSAVVSGIFLIILADSFIAVLLTYI
jgi:phospholipid/cholesterol/gamma-HCH transport system permease protein